MAYSATSSDKLSTNVLDRQWDPFVEGMHITTARQLIDHLIANPEPDNLFYPVGVKFNRSLKVPVNRNVSRLKVEINVGPTQRVNTPETSWNYSYQSTTGTIAPGIYTAEELIANMVWSGITPEIELTDDKLYVGFDDGTDVNINHFDSGLFASLVGYHTTGHDFGVWIPAPRVTVFNRIDPPKYIIVGDEARFVINDVASVDVTIPPYALNGTNDEIASAITGFIAPFTMTYVGWRFVITGGTAGATLGTSPLMRRLGFRTTSLTAETASTYDVEAALVVRSTYGRFVTNNNDPYEVNKLGLIHTGERKWTRILELNCFVSDFDVTVTENETNSTLPHLHIALTPLD